MLERWAHLPDDIKSFSTITPIANLDCHCLCETPPWSATSASHCTVPKFSFFAAWRCIVRQCSFILSLRLVIWRQPGAKHAKDEVLSLWTSCSWRTRSERLVKDLTQLVLVHECRFTAFLRGLEEGCFDGDIFLRLSGGAGGLKSVALGNDPGSKLLEAERAASEASTTSLSSNAGGAIELQ